MIYRIISLMFGVLVSIGVFSQKCRYEIDRIDAITELVIKRTEPIQITELNGQPLFIKGQCIGDKKYLKVRYYRYNGFTIQEMLPLEILFADNTSISLIPRNMPKKPESLSGFVKISSLLIYNLTTEQFIQLLEKPVAQISYHIDGGGKIDKEIRKRYQADLQYIMRCVHLDSDPF